MIRLLILYALIHGGCVAEHEITKGSYAGAMLRADSCETPVSWVEHEYAGDQELWHAVCADAKGNPIHNN